MQPQTASGADPYKPKWRHFHPQATVWVLNPFDHDVIFRVADENNNQSEFRIQARERAELPGGAIATLGVKTIIDEMIQNNKDDVLSLHNADVRAKYEEKVILRVKEAPAAVTTGGASGPIDLSISSKKDEEVEEKQAEVEKPFAEVPTNKQYIEPAPVATAPPLGDIASASLGTTDQIVETD